LRLIRYAESNTVFMQIRSDLEADGNLKAEFDECRFCTAPPALMAEDKTRLRQMLVANGPRYVETIKRSLRFQPVAADRGVRLIPDGASIEFDMEGNELLILEIRKDGAERAK
jgi:hypothetical protein